MQPFVAPAVALAELIFFACIHHSKLRRSFFLVIASAPFQSEIGPIARPNKVDNPWKTRNMILRSTGQLSIIRGHIASYKLRTPLCMRYSRVRREKTKTGFKLKNMSS